jgi:hypothetical protein
VPASDRKDDRTDTMDTAEIGRLQELGLDTDSGVEGSLGRLVIESLPDA